jgi:predicted amino acid dehydrogenase
MVKSELYEHPRKLVSELVKAHDLAESVGAGTISLTGVLPSTTNYGLELTDALSYRNASLKVTTGHDITSSSIVSTVQRLLSLCGRRSNEQIVGFLGLGAIGRRALRLMLHVLPPPERLLLCDLYTQIGSIEQFADEIRETGYRVELQVAPARHAVPPEFYDATLIVGVTNVPDVLEVPKLRPGTLIVDDSAPHCFDVERAYERLLNDHDILYTEGGLLQTPFPLEHSTYINRNIRAEIQQWFRSITGRGARNIGGCVLSSLLVQRFHGCEPALGEIDVARCMQGYRLLSKLEIAAAEPHCNPNPIPPHLVTKFVERYGCSPEYPHHAQRRPV